MPYPPHMLILIVCLCLLTAVYVALMLLYRKGWKEQPFFEQPHGTEPITSISVIIPARNEALNIEACIHSILANDYPRYKFEVIVVDDHSEDNTAALVEAFGDRRVRLIRLADLLDGQRLNAYKKKALTTGIELSNGELIVTTDADCIVSSQWLSNIATIYQKENPVMVIGPVDFIKNGRLVEVFQSLDFMTMQGITGAVNRLKLGNMCNGANLAFSKAAFQQVGGYTGIDHLASGDDFLLMMKLQQAFPGRLSYLKSTTAIVSTAPQPDWVSFLNQRIRWASKSGKYNDHRITAVLLMVYLLNLSLLVLAVFGFWNPVYWKIALITLTAKTISELFFLQSVAQFFQKKRQLLIFPLLQPIHILYIVVAGFLGMIGVYKWKGRSVK